MSKREKLKRIEALTRRRRLQRTGKLVWVDCVTLFSEAHWTEFEGGDAETRRRMRREFQERSDSLYASHTIPKSENGEITSIVISLALPAEDERWDSD